MLEGHKSTIQRDCHYFSLWHPNVLDMSAFLRFVLSTIKNGLKTASEVQLRCLCSDLFDVALKESEVWRFFTTGAQVS